MSKELIVKENEVVTWDSNKWKQIKEMFAPTISDNDFVMFMELSKAYELNPFKREIWCICYGGKAQIFTSRDGFLSIAHKSGMFNGMSTDFGYDDKGRLLWAETIVYNKACEHPIKCKVFFAEYTTNQNLWIKKPHVMLQKTAESTALRRAFNINGLYCPEESGDSKETKQVSVINNEEKEPEEVQEENKPVEANNNTEEDSFNKALIYIENTKTLDAIARAKKRIDQLKWLEDGAREFFLNDIIIKQIIKVLEPLKYNAEVEHKMELIINNGKWTDAHKTTITQVLLEKAKTNFKEEFK